MGDGPFDIGFNLDKSMNRGNENSTPLKQQDNNIDHFSALIHPNLLLMVSFALLLNSNSFAFSTNNVLVAECINHGSMLPLNCLDFPLCS
jgi:hypothetical protein